MQDIHKKISSNLETLMTKKRKVIIFSDIDGTIMSHNNYSVGSFRETMNILKSHKIIVSPVTSKTVSELEALQEQLNFCGPLVAENGGIIADFGLISNSNHQYDVDYHQKEIAEILNGLPKTILSQMKRFSELSTAEIQAITKLNLPLAERARMRLASEAFLWTGDSDTEQKLSKYLDEKHLRMVKGGRLYHAIGRRDKAAASKQIIHSLTVSDSASKLEVWALGDAENDLSLLKLADKKAIIRNTKINQKSKKNF